MRLLSLHVLALLLLVPYSALAQSKNSCHAFQAHKNRPARSCDGRVQIPSGLCSVCGVGVPMNENDGTYSNCQYTSGLETIGGTRNAQCVDLLQQYIDLNPCDGERANDVQDYTSNNPSSSARPRLDFFLYTVCEFACDCVPQIDASPVNKVVDTARGNCQAHAYFDVCLLFPQVKLISHADISSSSSQVDVSSLPPVCPLLVDWFQNSGDGNRFAQVPKTSVNPNVDFFLQQMLEATELLLPNNNLWDECLYLESTQQRISVTGPATPPTPFQPTPTAPAPPRPPTQSSGPCTNVAWSADVVDEQCTTEQPICAHSSGYQAGLGKTGSFCAKCVHLTRTSVDGGCSAQQPTCVAEDASPVPNEKVGQRCVGPDTAPQPPSSSSISWRTVNASPVVPTHEEACFVMVNRNAYLIGGRTRRSISVLNVDTLEWSTSSNLPQSPTKMHHMQCVAVGTSIYIVSAFTGNYPVETALPDTWIFDTMTETWSTAPGIPSPRTRGAGAAVYDGGSFIYVAGGNLGGHGPNSEAVALFDVYDTSTQTWTSLPDMPNRRDHTGGGFVANGELCVAGGRLGDEQSFFNAVVLPTNCYNVGTGAWSTKANIPQGRAGSAYGTTCDGKLMVAGGESFNRAWDRVDVFDGTSWTTVDPLVTGRHGIQLAVSCTSPQVIAIAVGNGGQGGGNPLRSVEFYYGLDSQPVSIPAPTPQPSTAPTPQPITLPIRDPTSQPITQSDPTPQPIARQPTRDPTARPTQLSPVPPPPTSSEPCVNVNWSANVVDEQCTTEQPICSHSSGYQAGLGKMGSFCAKCVHLTRNSVDGGCTSEQPTCVAKDGSPVANEKVGQQCQGSSPPPPPPPPPSGPCVNMAWSATVVDDNCSADLPVCAQSSQYQPALGQTGNFCAKCVHLTRTNVDGGCTSQQPTCVAEDGSPVSNEKVGLRCV